MPVSKNFVAQITDTEGTGLTLNLTGLYTDSASFAEAYNNQPAELTYSIKNGDNKEIGIGNFNGVNQFDRTTVKATLVAGVYNDSNPTRINLIGQSTVKVSFNAEEFNDFYDHTQDTTNPHNVDAAQAGADPAGSAAAVQSNLDTTNANLGTHVARVDNPHSVTAAQAGADPSGSAATVQSDLDLHKANTGNPHLTTAAQVGADPLGSAGAVQSNLDVHIADDTNPHAVTASQTGAEPGLGNPSTNGFVLSSTIAGVRSWVAPGSGGASLFTELLDTPADYSGQQGKLVKVNATEDGLIYGDPSGSSVSWGDITGTLSNQTDLQSVLDSKAVIADITYETLNAAGDVGTGTNQLAQGSHLHPGVYDPAGSAATVQSNLSAHEADGGNPHNTTALQVGAPEEAPADGTIYARQNNAWIDAPQTPVGGFSTHFNFSTNTSATDPGSGNVKVNAADIRTATFIYLSATTSKGNPIDPSIFKWGKGDYFGLFDELKPDGVYYEVTGAVVDNTGWYTVPVSALSGGTASIGNGRASRLIEISSPDSRLNRGGALDQVYAKLGPEDWNADWVTADAAFVGADPAGSAAAVQGNLDTHESDFTNPHNVTAAQVSAEPDLGNPAQNGYVLSSTIGGVRSWVAQSGGGASAFTDLTDTPADYTGQQGKLVKVNATEDGLIFGDPSGTTVSWGDITGTLSNQTDLQTELDAKEDDLGNPVSNGLVLASTTGGVRSWVDKIDASGVTYENLDANGDVGTGATQVAQGDHLHPGVYDPAGSAATVQTNLDAHEGDFTNPHNVTASQTGAEADLGNPASDGYILSSTVAGIRSWIPQPSGGGEANTASNAGIGGVGITLPKQGVDLPFKAIDVEDSKLSVTDDVGNKEVVIGVNEANFAHMQNTSNPHSTTAAQVGAEPDLGNPASDGYVLSSTAAGARSWVAQSGGGDLTDAIFPTFAVMDANVAAAAAINFATGNSQTVDAAVNPAVTVTSPTGRPGHFALTIANSGSLTSIAPSAGGDILWENDVPPSWAGKTKLSLYYDGSEWAGSGLVNVL